MSRISTISVAAAALLLGLGTPAFAAKMSTPHHELRYTRAAPLYNWAGADCSLNAVIGSQDYCVGTSMFHSARRHHG
jgi:hypothetical protein